MEMGERMATASKQKIFLYITFGSLLRFPPALYMLRRAFVSNPGKVSSIAFHITGRCNLKCVYCNQRSPKSRDLSLGKFCRLIDDAKANGISEVTLTGGEPFIHPEIFSMLNFCQCNRLKPLIYTNGTLIGESIVSKLKVIKGLCLIFKFDSSKSYKRHVGGNVYHKVCEAIRLCTANKIKVIARINVTGKNKKFLSNIINDAFVLGAEPVIERHMPLKHDATNRKLELNAEEWQEVLQTYYKCCAKNLGVSTKIFWNYKNNQARLLGYKCYGFNSTIVVRMDGKVVPCGLAPDELSIGNINSEPLLAILEKYYKQREIWNSIPEECEGCKEAETCGGGCKAYTYLKLKRFDKKDPLCNVCTSRISV